jgi:uncharacterized membrane protein
MKKFSILSAVVTAALAINSAHAGTNDMEQCKVVDKNGKGLIKAHKGSCAGGGGSCAGSNEAGDPNAFIIVPKGQCAKINMGDFSGVSPAVKDSIEGAN